MLLWLICLLLVAWLLTKPFYWKLRGVPSTLPLPLFGNSLPSVYLSNKEFFDSIYYRFADVPYVGMHMLTLPALVLKDPQVIQEVLEEKAPSFSSHGNYLNGDRDPFAKSLFHIHGAEWKSLRTKLSPIFSPVKVKNMLIVSKKSFDKLLHEVESNVGKEMDIHSAATFLTVDVTVSSFFGLDTPIFEEGLESDFFKSAVDLNTPSSMIKVMIGMVSPRVYDFFNFVAFTPSANAFLVNMVAQSVKACKQNGGNYKNAMDTLLALISTDSKVYDDRFLKAQGALLFTAGVDTVANTLSFTLYELAKNEDLQQELRVKLGTGEGRTLFKEIVTETLRKYPSFGVITRKCTRRCRLSTGLEVEPGTLIIIPVQSVHNDPALFPRPEDFTPGRHFPRGANLGFGAGPRICLGKQMAYAVLEEALTKLLQNYQFTPGTRPVELSPNTFITTTKNGLWIKVRKLNSN